LNKNDAAEIQSRRDGEITRAGEKPREDDKAGVQ